MLLHYREQHQIISIKEKEVFHIEERKCFVFLLSILSRYIKSFPKINMKEQEERERERGNEWR